MFHLERFQTIFIDLSSAEAISVTIQVSKIDQLWFNSYSKKRINLSGEGDKWEEHDSVGNELESLLKENAPTTFMNMKAGEKEEIKGDFITISCQCLKNKYKHYVDGREVVQRVAIVLRPNQVQK
mmetsp:Transcript_16039/g.18148  ORF Transcript_16039/g.18148 Transcript_16039/m.18148 type:complete len:125 (+) Transcript_16039:246-620(+)